MVGSTSKPIFSDRAVNLFLKGMKFRPTVTFSHSIRELESGFSSNLPHSIEEIKRYNCAKNYRIRPLVWRMAAGQTQTFTFQKVPVANFFGQHCIWTRLHVRSSWIP